MDTDVSGSGLSDILKNIVGNGYIFINEPMARHTSFRIGGPADILVKPQLTEQIKKILVECKKAGVIPFIMGNGTNILVGSKGIRGVVIKLSGEYNDFTVNRSEGEIVACAGAMLSHLSKAAYDNSLAGMEFAAGIPGSVGGAVAINAGAYGSEMKNIVIRTEYIDQYGQEQSVIEGVEAHCFNYRRSIFQDNGWLVLKSTLKLNIAPKESIRELMDDLAQRRSDTQPLEYPSAGSVFKRPEGHYVGKLIDECSLRGFTIGGAQVSLKHSNFIINKDNASATDVIKLIDHIKSEVLRRFGIELETEVRMVGEE